MTLLLNCDLGESFGSWHMGMDSAVMPHIDQANIACGFHAGDPMTMNRTLDLAKQHNVTVGAHPSYPDLVGFGRRSMNCSADEIRALIGYQVSALEGMARSKGLTLTYVKPHGALYNDMMTNQVVRHAIMEAIADFHGDIRLMLQATPRAEEHKQEAKMFNIELYFEAFADRCYDDDGHLLSRKKPGAVHGQERILKQVQQLNNQGTVTTISGLILPLQADTLCVHGDNPEGIQSIEAIRGLITP